MCASPRIYEGTSEIQQSIIAMYRWKETVRSKGAFYAGLAADMDTLHGECDRAGAAIVAAAVRGLNDVVQHLHARKQTRSQIVMFTFADMMTICEVAAAMSAKAARMAAEGHADAEAFLAASRVFARKAARAVQDGAVRCAGGLVSADDPVQLREGEELLATINGRLPLALTAGLWPDMTRVGEYLKVLD